MPTIESRISIGAPIELVYDIAMDVEAFPSFMPDVESVEITEKTDPIDGKIRTVTKWVGLVPEFKLKVRWIEEDNWDKDSRTCTFKQLSGDYQVYEGTWAFTENDGNSTQFVSTLTYELEIPLIGPLLKRIVAKKMQDNIDRVLSAIKGRAESQMANPASSG
jgi:coenzyme Q-binding protein COQ10